MISPRLRIMADGMEYTYSTMPKWREVALLFRKSMTSTKLSAERIFSLYSRLVADFNLHGKCILEIGAGGRGAFLRLFDDTNEVYGIDKYLGYFDEGWFKFLKTSVRGMCFDPVFYRHLRKLNGGILHRRPVKRMDAERMDFPDASFDFVYSRYVLEHVERVDKIAQEAYRSLKPGGVTYHVFALYSSLEGGHTLDWRRFNPWQHLYSTVPSNAYVNKYRLSVYKEAFEKAFGKENVEINLPKDPEAEALLTDDIRSRLSDYDPRELIVGSPEIIAYKKAL